MRESSFGSPSSDTSPLRYSQRPVAASRRKWLRSSRRCSCAGFLPSCPIWLVSRNQACRARARRARAAHGVRSWHSEKAVCASGAPNKRSVPVAEQASLERHTPTSRAPPTAPRPRLCAAHTSWPHHCQAQPRRRGSAPCSGGARPGRAARLERDPRVRRVRFRRRRAHDGQAPVREAAAGGRRVLQQRAGQRAVRVEGAARGRVLGVRAVRLARGHKGFEKSRWAHPLHQTLLAAPPAAQALARGGTRRAAARGAPGARPAGPGPRGAAPRPWELRDPAAQTRREAGGLAGAAVGAGGRGRTMYWGAFFT